MASNRSKSAALSFDPVRISIGDSVIAKSMSMETFIFLMSAARIPGERSGEDMYCIGNASLLHNLRGKCFVRFARVREGKRFFSGVRFVIDPDSYPGLKNLDGMMRMAQLKSFVAVALSDRLRAMSGDGGAQSSALYFKEISEDVYESRFVRICYETDRYHVVICFSYKDREPEPETAVLPQMADAGELTRRIDELEARLIEVERENRELRKVNDRILELFNGLGPAHELAEEAILEQIVSGQKPAQEADDGAIPQIPHKAETPPARRGALINRYLN